MSSDEEEVVKRLAHAHDCQPCRLTGTAAAFAVGSYILYHTRVGFYANRPYHKLVMRIAAAGAYYMSAARLIYLPPFKHLAPIRHGEEAHSQT